MRCFLSVVAIVTILAAARAVAQGLNYHRGRAATADEIRAWDISIGPEGKELPPGRGTAKEGAKVYAQKCASCHGPTGMEAKFPHGPLVGGKGSLNTAAPLKTVGSYWPFATTVWDYIFRAMPRGNEGTLSATEVYAVTAFLLYRNDIIKEDYVIDSETLPKIRMPNRNAFTPERPSWKPAEARPFGFYE